MEELMAYLRRVPALTVISASPREDSVWWVKLQIELHDSLAWRVVQELAHVLNYLSGDERLPTVFMPVSPPPYLNGGPATFLSWVIESRGGSMPPEEVAQWLEGRLPRPVDSRESWRLDDEDP